MATFVSYVEPFINGYGVHYQDLPPVLTAYHKVLTTDKLNVFQKMTYIPLLSNLSGLVNIIVGVVMAPLAFIASIGLLFIAPVGLWLTGPFVYIGGVLIMRGLLQQIPVIGNTILAQYDAAALMRGL